MTNSNTLTIKTFIGDELVELIGEYKLLKIYIDSKYHNHIYLIQDNRLLCKIDLPNNYLNSKIKILESMYEQITFLLESPIKYEKDNFEDLVLTRLEIILNDTQSLIEQIPKDSSSNIETKENDEVIFKTLKTSTPQNMRLMILNSLYYDVYRLFEDIDNYDNEDIKCRLEIILNETKGLLAKKELDPEALTKEKNLVSELEILRSCYEVLFDYILDSNHTNDLKIDLSREVLLRTKSQLDEIV